MATAARVFSGYRRLFRARKILFQGDDRAMRESRVEIRKQFGMNRAVSDPAHIEGLLTMVDEAEDMLLHGIVRGELNDQTGNYEVKIKAEHASDDGAATATNNLEPITAETADKMEGKVTVTNSSSKGTEDKS
uniref:Complex 1 LYR protein domain-containing protein n=1 Tax=Minutocellus polymorphus TaxID=265543 RepID=A0A7S0B3T0_9STRA